MSDGYKDNNVHYHLSIKGKDVPRDAIDINIWVGELEASRVDSFADAFEAGFMALGKELKKVNGVDTVQLNKSRTGKVSESEVFNL